MSIQLAYLSLIIIWSTTPLAIKWSIDAGHFLFGVSGRMVLGALLCLLIIALLRIKFPWHRAAVRCYLAASVSIYGSMLMTYWGAQFISSGLISVLFGLAPIFTSLMATVWLNERHFSVTKWLGMLIGLLGLALVFNTSLKEHSQSLKGLLAILAAVFLYSFSTVWTKRLSNNISPLATTSGGLLIALLLYGVTWLWLGESWPTHLTTRTLLSIIYLGIFGSVVGFMLYYYILKNLEAPRAALISLITPVSALLLGQSINGEVISMMVWLGAAVILSGLGMYQWGDKLVRMIREV